MQDNIRDNLDRKLPLLTQLQQRIMKLRFGLEGGRSLSVTEVCEELESTVEQLRLEEREALAIIRKHRKK